MSSALPGELEDGGPGGGGGVTARGMRRAALDEAAAGSGAAPGHGPAVAPAGRRPGPGTHSGCLRASVDQPWRGCQ